MPRQELVFSRQTRRGGSQASRLLSVAPHTLRQAQRRKQQAASSASKQEASTGASLQAARPAATRERCHFWNPTNPALVVNTTSIVCHSMQLLLFYRNMLSKLESTEQSLVCVKQFSQKFIVSGTVHSETAQWDSVNHRTHGVVRGNLALWIQKKQKWKSLLSQGEVDAFLFQCQHWAASFTSSETLPQLVIRE